MSITEEMIRTLHYSSGEVGATSGLLSLLGGGYLSGGGGLLGGGSLHRRGLVILHSLWHPPLYVGNTCGI